MAKNESGNTVRRHGVRIINCTCKHAFQDSQYGPGRRVANQNSKGAKCTVCSRQVSDA